MPVHFKNTSEYKSHYQPLQSVKSASFEPQPEQAADPAGKISTKLGILREPQFQGKKRVTGPTTSLSTEFNRYPSTPSDDFALLGKNEKFMENVRYKSKTTKSRGASPAKQQKLIKQDKENLRDFAKTAPAPFVDTSKFRAKSTEDPPTPQAPRKEKYAPAGIKKDVKLSKDEKPVRSSKEPRQSIIKHVDANKMESITKEEVKDKLIHNMNEFVQTNMEKGVADSAPEAPADYALRYKAGVSAPRPHRKHSEYSKSFTWKDPVRSSPLLAAEQVIYNSNPAVAPFRGDFQKASEYAAQFQKYKAVTPPGDREDKAVPTVESQKKRSKVRRSKSMGALRPDKAPPAGSAPLISPDNKRQTVESELQGTALEERVPAATHGKLKRPRSEYSSNFRSPTKYNVERGAWRGADPPQLQPARSGDSDSGKPVLSNWFAEVLELRRKAQEYRRRAQGTHFSREHLVQLMAQQADMWDTISTARSGTSTLSALSLESGMEAQRKKEKNVKDLKEELKLSNLEENVDQAESPAAKPIQKQTEKAFKKRGQERRATLENRSELDEYEESVKKSSNGDDISLMGHEGSDEEVGKPDMEPIIHDDVTKQRKKRGKQGGQRKTAWEEDQWSELTPVSQENGERNGQGRVPTPKLKKASSSSKRHHFDRTTPIIGGALLTSPPRAEKKTGKRTNISKSWCTPIDFEDESTVVSSESFSKIAGQTKGENYSVQKGPLAAHPTFGSPSKDSHILRDDDLSADVPLVTEFVDSPAKGTKSPAKSTNDEQKTQKPKSSKPRRFDLQPTIKEGYGQTYSKPVAWGIDGGLPVPRIDPDDDVLSVSARSIASSCSLASEVYERAQKRTEEFWGKKGIASR